MASTYQIELATLVFISSARQLSFRKPSSVMVNIYWKRTVIFSNVRLCINLIAFIILLFVFCVFCFLEIPSSRESYLNAHDIYVVNVKQRHKWAHCIFLLPQCPLTVWHVQQYYVKFLQAHLRWLYHKMTL